MARGPETGFIASIHRHLPSELYSMKNHNEYNGGIADCWYSGVANDLWVEYKFIAIPKRTSTLIRPFDGLTPLQRDWLWRRHTEGRNVWVVIGCGEGGGLFNLARCKRPIWDEYAVWAHEVWRSNLESRTEIAAAIAEHCMG